MTVKATELDLICSGLRNSCTTTAAESTMAILPSARRVSLLWPEIAPPESEPIATVRHCIFDFGQVFSLDAKNRYSSSRRRPQPWWHELNVIINEFDLDLVMLKGRRSLSFNPDYFGRRKGQGTGKQEWHPDVVLVLRRV
jgi:hypothetical protein